MSRFLMIAYTTYMHDGRVKRHAEALAERGDHVDVICLATGEDPITNGVNVIGLPMRRYRGESKAAYLRSYMRFFSMAAQRAARMSMKQRYDVVIVCTMPDAVIVCAILPKFMGSKVVLDVHDTMPELYRDKFGGARGAAGAKLLMLEERASSWWADRVLAVHDLHRDRLQQAGVPASKIHVVMNSPDTRIFDLHKNGDAPSNQFTLICHGTVTQRLGLDLAISAVGLLRSEIPGAAPQSYRRGRPPGGIARAGRSPGARRSRLVYGSGPGRKTARVARQVGRRAGSISPQQRDASDAAGEAARLRDA